MSTIAETLATAVRHHQAGRLPQAERLYRQILDRNPIHAEALHLLGVLTCQKGQPAVAVELLGRATVIDPQNSTYHSNLGNALQMQGQLDEAVACYRRALQLKSDWAETHNNLGNALRAQGKLEEAVASYQRALQLQPDYAEAHNNLGVALQEQRKPEETVAAFRRALQLKPDYAGAHYNLGNFWKTQGKLDEAVASYLQAVQFQPRYAEAYLSLGLALKEQGKLEDAVACYQRAAQLQPDFAETHNNLGNALQAQGRLDEAVAAYRRALQLKSDYAAAYNNLGIALKEQGRREEAVASLQRALQLKPEYADAHKNLGLALLLGGDFERGWAEYEWRWRCQDSPRPEFSQPPWEGAPLANRTILLYAEQGLGDTVQFIRYAELVRQLGGRVVVECQQPLSRLLTSCRGIDQVVERGTVLPEFDVHAPLLSLPGILKTRLANIPAQIPYISGDKALVERWRAELSPASGFKIGIVWRGNPQHKNDRDRSIPLSQFETLANVLEVQFFSLQKGSGAEELTRVAERAPITDVGSRLEDFTDTAAVLMNLDLVIGCDTAVVHLAGAMGIPVWVALPFAPDWRWLLDRTDSPWYPTMRLFRQRRPGDWPGVFEEIRAAVSELLHRGAK